MNMQRRKQDGAILFVVMMIMMMVSVLVMMAVQRGKSNTQIGMAQAQQVEAFDNAETMLSRVKFALEQIAVTPSIAMDGKPNGSETVIWLTKHIAAEVNDGAGGSKDINEPLFAQSEFAWDASNAMTCADLDLWLKRNGSRVNLDCEGVFPTEEDNQPLIFIEFVTKQQSVSDIDQILGAYFFRITILGQGYHSGRSIVQGVTGVDYQKNN